MPEILKATTVDVTVNGETFTLKIPGVGDSIKIGLAERALRKKYGDAANDPVGDPRGLDMDTYLLVRGIAIMETCLTAATAAWPWRDEKGTPVCDHTAWPDEKIDDIITIAMMYDQEVSRFRSGRDRNSEPSGEKTVAGGGDPGPQEPLSSGTSEAEPRPT